MNTTQPSRKLGAFTPPVLCIEVAEMEYKGGRKEKRSNVSSGYAQRLQGSSEEGSQRLQIIFMRGRE